ncbi:alanine--tRNA ligase [Nitrosomonadales bacterium]|nr:alanine--tRNA ligase [Nitrosomonadales bacterium]
MNNKNILSEKEIRKQFLDFFATKGHEIVSSSSLVPQDDPTLLFTNAGMNQFKEVFLGIEEKSYKRATSSQHCVRAGGKHNDLENVGYTARHLTFFEMLGNFSFGDYFKKEAITFAWELLTEIYKIPIEKLLVTVYEEDKEALEIWSQEIGLPKDKIILIGDNKGGKYASDNFWMMGDTGPCGPCSEIFYDHGKDYFGGPPGSKDEDGDRFIEIWNLVFMQYNRDEQGKMHLLPEPSVDTGMGLERISAILQNVHSNYEIDLFKTLIAEIAKITNTKDLGNNSLKVIADHIRTTTYLIKDGVLPTNEGRGYVLRRIIRRAIRHGYKLGCNKPFFNKLVPLVLELMDDDKDISLDKKKLISNEILLEEERFFITIENGMSILDQALNDIKNKDVSMLDGEVAFKLHDTYGFPLDLTADICRENKIEIDTEAFEVSMKSQKTMARESGKFNTTKTLPYEGIDTEFLGYIDTHSSSKIVAMFKDSNEFKDLKKGDEAILILDKSPFYAESGGQIGDSGYIKTKDAKFYVQDTIKIKKGVFGHIGVLESGSLKCNEQVEALIDEHKRNDIKRNHSVTHLLHKALKIVLGDHVEQKGSLVDNLKTRFDFSHIKPISKEEIQQIESIVNNEILTNKVTTTEMMSIDRAKESGALMLFGEKYDSEVRVLNIGNSIELCGGTHVSNTGDIGLFKIYAETGVASGVRRIEGVTGLNLIKFLNDQEEILTKVSKDLNTKSSEIPTKVSSLLSQLKENEKIQNQLKSELALNQTDEMLPKASKINNFEYLSQVVDNQGPNELRDMIDKLKLKLKTAVIILASVKDSNVTFAVGVTDNLTDKIDAGSIAKTLGEKVGGKGGGRKNMAMAGGTNTKLVQEAFKLVQTNLSS